MDAAVFASMVSVGNVKDENREYYSVPDESMRRASAAFRDENRPFEVHNGAQNTGGYQLLKMHCGGDCSYSTVVKDSNGVNGVANGVIQYAEWGMKCDADPRSLKLLSPKEKNDYTDVHEDATREILDEDRALAIPLCMDLNTPLSFRSLWSAALKSAYLNEDDQLQEWELTVSLGNNRRRRITVRGITEVYDVHPCLHTACMMSTPPPTWHTATCILPLHVPCG